jgi:uncharacterized protein with HEPN domain
MPPDVRKFLHDIKQACGLIEQFNTGKSIDDFRSDSQLRSAVERQFITIGEALQQAVRAWPDLEQRVSECRRIINFRNVMVHGYAQIAIDTVWGVVEKDLPILREEVDQLLRTHISDESQ